MRLINADRLNEVIDRNIAYPDGFKQLVDIQPTAYDVDKVVEGLAEEIELVVTQYPLGGKYIKKSRAIEIVKSGMKE